MTEDGIAGALKVAELDELDDEVATSEPHAASVTTREAAAATSAREAETRDEFTVVTVQPR
jgi:hypothetical protein